MEKSTISPSEKILPTPMFACLIQLLPKAGSLSFYFNSRAVLEFDFERLFSLISRAFI